jgi:hypothetical protein
MCRLDPTQLSLDALVALVDEHTPHRWKGAHSLAVFDLLPLVFCLGKQRAVLLAVV